MRPGGTRGMRQCPKLCRPVSPASRSCQSPGVPGPAQRTRRQPGASTAQWRALPLAPSSLRRVAGPAQRGCVPASRHAVAGPIAGLRESAPDGRDPAGSPGHKPPRGGSQGRRESSLLSRQPRASQSNDLCVNLWTISVNAQINHCIAVDTRRCGKVDNRTAQSCQAAAFRCPQGTAVLPLPASRLHQDSDRRRQVTGRRGGATRWRRPVTTQLTRGVGKPRRAAPAQLSAL